MRERIEVPDRLDGVVGDRDSSRDYDDTLAGNARKVLADFVKDAGTEEAAANKLARAEARGKTMSQSTVGRALKGQPSARILIALSRATGRSIDEILGLQPAATGRERQIAKEAAREAVREYRAQSTVPPSETGVRPTRRNTGDP